MGFEVKSPNVTRGVKFVAFAILFVTVVVFLMNNRIPYRYWRDGHKSINLPELKRNSDENEEFLTASGIGDHVNDTTEYASTLRMLIEDPTSCFEKYEMQNVFKSEHVSSKPKVASEKWLFTSMILSFNKIMASLDIDVGIIEPSVIHCLLKKRYKDLLAKRGFSITNYTTLNTTITYGIIADDVLMLQKAVTIKNFRKQGFQPYFMKTPLPQWMVNNDTDSKTPTYLSHIFYSYYDWTIHVVVFQNRNNYLWCSKLMTLSDDFNIVDKSDLLFTDFDAVYEKFTFVPMRKKWPNFENLFIPSIPHYFLFQIPSSRFLECNLSRAVEVKSSTDSPKDQSHLDTFINKTLIALHELKTLFNPLLMHFWIFSGTMLGWYRQCGIIPYTSDADFAAWASELDDLDSMVKHLRQNENLTIRERMGIPEEALEFNLNTHGLRVDVFFMYKISNGSWASGHRPSKGYYFRYHYPPFTLCSAELLKEKVLVPCETEDVIRAEYGPNWMKPVKSWYYESSIFNRGPNIYWDEKRRQKTFQEY